MAGSPRTRRRAAGRAALIGLLGLIAMPSTAVAYIDPSSGSILLQLLLGGVAGVLVALKLGWKRLTSWRNEPPADAPPPNRPR
jgi:hypothetical protein